VEIKTWLGGMDLGEFLAKEQAKLEDTVEKQEDHDKDVLRAQHLGMSLDGYIIRKDLLKEQDEKILERSDTIEVV